MTEVRGAQIPRVFSPPTVRYISRVQGYRYIDRPYLTLGPAYRDVYRNIGLQWIQDQRQP